MFVIQLVKSELHKHTSKNTLYPDQITTSLTIIQTCIHQTPLTSWFKHILFTVSYSKKDWVPVVFTISYQPAQLLYLSTATANQTAPLGGMAQFELAATVNNCDLQAKFTLPWQLNAVTELRHFTLLCTRILLNSYETQCKIHDRLCTNLRPCSTELLHMMAMICYYFAITVVTELIYSEPGLSWKAPVYMIYYINLAMTAPSPTRIAV